MWVNKRQIAAAKEYDVLSYLQIADPAELVKFSRNEYCLRSHDSFKISNGKWHWYSRNIGGRSAIDYLIKVRGYSFPDAVNEVNRAMKGRSPSFFYEEKPKRKEVVLPEKNSDNNTVISYLSGRGIDANIIDLFISKGEIYESKKYKSAVFVGRDESGKPAHASYRDTGSKGRKGDFSGSDKHFVFRYECEKSETVRVFESAIDMLSYMTICSENGRFYHKESLISTAGISAARYSDEYKLPLSLERYLEKNPNTKTIILQFDNDFAGQKAAANVTQKLKNDFKIMTLLPPKGKDFNDYLMIRKGMKIKCREQER